MARLMKKYYVEFQHPSADKVLWHYFVEAESEKAAKKACEERFIKEHENDILLDTQGLFMMSVEEITSENADQFKF